MDRIRTSGGRTQETHVYQVSQGTLMSTNVGESFSYTLKDPERERDGTPIKGVNPSWSRLTLGTFTGFETA